MPDKKNNHIDLSSQQYDKAEIDEKFEDVDKRFIRQEHRLISRTLNLIKSFKSKNSESKHRNDAWIAFLFGGKSRYLLLISFTGVFALTIAYQSNQLIAVQNLYYREQVYIQAKENRELLQLNITEKLYTPDDKTRKRLADYRACKRNDITSL